MDEDKIEWSAEKTIELIKRYRAFPCLWDVGDVGYKDRKIRELAIEKLAKSFNASINEIKRKVHNLRNQFNQEQAKIIKYIPKSKGDVFISRWSYFDLLKFIKLKSRPSNHVFVDCNEINEEQDQDSSIEMKPKFTNKVETNFENDETEEEFNEYDTEEIQLAEIPFQIDKKKSSGSIIDIKPTRADLTIQNKKRKLLNNEEYLKELIEIDTTQQSQSKEETFYFNTSSTTTTPRENDEYSIFGQFVANELRNLKSIKNRNKLKRMIQKSVLEVSCAEDSN